MSESSLRQYSSSGKPSSLADYYRKTILSGGMVHSTLGLAFLISWVFLPDLFFQSELAVGIFFSLSGVAAVTCGKFRMRTLDYICMCSSVLSAFSSLSLFLIIIYVLYEMESHSLSNPWVGIFIIYSILGFVFAVLLVVYTNLALKANKQSPLRRRNTEETTETPVTKVTATLDDNGVESQHWMPMPSASSNAELSKTARKPATTLL